MKSDHAFHRLTAGEFELDFQHGAVRYIRFGQTETIRMIYLAVRDHNWGTLEPEIHNLNITKNDHQYLVTFRMLFGNPAVFEANCLFEGHEDHLLEFSFKGKALSDFRRNRIGFCVLHPPDTCAGKPCKIVHTDGSEEMGVFPESISPYQPFKDIQRMGWWPRDAYIEIGFEGDIFEMEDQRNWSDASFKTYSTPLEKPFPVTLKKGDRVEQRLTIQADLLSSTNKKRFSKADELITYSVLEDHEIGIPSIGSLYRSESGKMDSTAFHILKQTGINHLRYDIDFSFRDWYNVLVQFIRDLKEINIEAEIAFHLTGNYYSSVRKTVNILKQNNVKVRCIEFFTKRAKATRMNEVKGLIKFCRRTLPGCRIGAGTDFNFAEINRHRFNPGPIDFVLYSICPQVHAFDDLSLIENLQAQADTVVSAKSAFPGADIHVSVISLLRRSNPDATAVIKPDDSFGHFDKRQMSVLGAQWGLVSLKHLIAAKSEWITIFETHGYHGLILKDDKNKYNGIYPADRWIRSPFSIMLGIIQKFNPETIIPTKSSAPLKSEVLLFKRGDKYLTVLINFSTQDQRIRNPVSSDLSSCFLLNNEIFQKQSLGIVSVVSFRPSEGSWQNDTLTLPPNSVVLLKQ